MKKLLQDIQARIIAQVPTLKYVDEDWGQLDYYNPNPPTKFPCCLIDSTQASWSNQARNLQMGTVEITITVANLRLSNSSGAAPTNQKAKSFEIYDTLNQVFQALQGWSGDKSYSKLIRLRSSKKKREDGVRIYETVFSVELYDSNAVPNQLTAPASPSVLNLPK